MPNKWLVGWAGLTVLSLFFNGTAADMLGWAGSGTLLMWSLLEIFRGVNYFRRAVGLLVLVFAVMMFVRSL